MLDDAVRVHAHDSVHTDSRSTLNTHQLLMGALGHAVPLDAYPSTQMLQQQHDMQQQQSDDAFSPAQMQLMRAQYAQQVGGVRWSPPTPPLGTQPASTKHTDWPLWLSTHPPNTPTDPAASG
jgi:hypothetical protein